MPRGFGHVLEPQIGGGEAEAQDIGIAEVADHAACDERLADRIGFRMAEGELAAALRGIGGADEIEIGAAFRQALAEEFGERLRFGIQAVDADFGKPSIMGKLGLDAGKGFMDVLANPAAHIEDFVVGTDIPGLWVLPAGQRTGRDSEYLASERTWSVLNRLTRGAPNRIIVFDSPPTLAATPAAELAKQVGQALLVARADLTGRAALEDAVDLLSACPDIKLLLNDATFSPSGRRFGTYYGYGE